MPIIIDPRSGVPAPRRADRAPRSERQGRVPGPGDVAQIDAQVLRDPGLHATPEDFGAGIGKAIEQFGAAASRVASDFAEMRREAEDDTAEMAGLSEARVRFTRVAESMKTQAMTAEGLTGNLGKALSEETDAILRDLRQVRGLRPSKGGEAAIRRRLGVLASRMVVRGARFENGVRLAQLGRAVDASGAEAGMAAFDSPGDFPAIIAETEATLARFKDKLPPDALAAKVVAAKETIAENTVAGLIELDPALAIQGLKEGVFDDDLPAADRKRLRARAKAAVSDRRAQAERGQSRERAAAGADGARRLVVLEGAIERGEAGEQAIAEAADILDEPTRARLREKLDARRAEDAARNRRIETVSAVLAGRAPATGDGDVKLRSGGGEDLRPDTPEWRQAVDDHYASLADALETMDPETRARFEDDYAQATGGLPNAVAKTLRAGLLSADPAAQAAAAQRLARFDPALVSTIPANERRRAQAIAEFADLGLLPARAVELAEEKLSQLVLPTEDLTGSAGAGDDMATGRAEEPPLGDEQLPGSLGTDQKADGGKRRPDGAAGARKAARGPDLTDIYRRHGVDPKSAATLAKTGVVPQVEPEIDHKLVNLIRAIRDVNPKDGQAVHQLRKRIGEDLKGFPTRQHVFHFHLTRRLGGQSRADTVKALAPQAVLKFGRQIDPKNAKLLADVLNVTPEGELPLRRKINRRFGGLSGDAGIFSQTMERVLRYRESGGKKGMSPKQAAEKLMPYVDARKAEFGKNVLKGAATALTATKILSPLLARVIDIIDAADTATTLTGTKKQKDRVGEIIGNGK